MKIKNILYPAAFLALTAGVFASCEKGPQGGETEPATETGYLSFEIALENMHAARDAGGEVNGVPEESQLNSLRIILYDVSGKAELVETYVISNMGDYYELIDDQLLPGEEAIRFGTDNRVPIPNGELDKVVIRRNPIQLKRQNYQLAVLVNNIDYNSGFNFFSDPTNIESATRPVGHDIGSLTGAIDFYQGLSQIMDPALPYSFPLAALNLGLAGFRHGWSGDIPSLGGLQGYMSGLGILMSNADGMIQINKRELGDTPEEAPTKVVYVDRILAKAVLLKDPAITEDNGIYTVPSGGRVDGMNWVPDILNHRVYPIRQFGNHDNANTPRTARYATDPNFNGLSQRDPGPMTPTETQKEHFFYLSEAYDPQTRRVIAEPIGGGRVQIDPFEKTWASDEQAMLDSCMWYYLPENTMTANEQFEDVTTRAVLRSHYSPGPYATVGGTPFPVGQSYYYFNGMAFTHAQLQEYIDSGYDTYRYELSGLSDLLYDDDFLRSYGWEDAITEPDESRSVDRLTYYKDGLNYYSVLIRHFGDSEQPTPMAYGRYGVVRNNVYNITISDIYGPGSIRIPDPTGPDDKDAVIRATITVAPWKTVSLNFEF